MRMSLRSLPAVMLVFSLVGAAEAQSLKVTETDALRLLYFDPAETYLVPRIIQTYHDSLERQQSILGYTPGEKTTILLTDFADYANAGATSVPFNSVFVDIAPLAFTFETAPPAERMFTVMNHEMVHIATTDLAASRDKRYRKLFGGKVLPTAEHPESILYGYLTAPRKLSPRWFLEGLAVFQETWMAGGLGRSQGGYDEMVFRAKVRDGAHFYDPLGLVAEGIKVDFQVGANAYLYGERFMSYVAYTWSPEQLTDWAVRSEKGKRDYRDAFGEIFGTPLEDAWSDWIAFEHEWQQQNLARIRQFPVTPYESLTDNGLGSVSRAFYDAERNSLFAGVRYPGVVAHLAELSLDSRDTRRLRDIKVPMLYKVTSIAYDQSSRTIFYTADNYAYRDLMAHDVESGETRTLLKDERIGEIAYNPVDRSIWGVRHLNGYVSLVRVQHPYEQWDLVETLPYGTVVYDVDVSADGRLLSASFGDVEGNQSVRVFETQALLDGELEPVAVLEMGQAVPEGFVFSPDNRYLFGSAYYTGVSNIFRYEIDTGDLEAVSNTESGFFRPIPIDNDNLIVFHYTGEGFLPVRIKAEPLEDVAAIDFFGAQVIRKHPQLETWRAGTGESVPAESRIVSEGTYVPLKNMRFESVYPTLLGYKDSESLGLKFNWSDAVRLDTLAIGIGYSADSDLPTDEKLNLAIDFKHTAISANPLAGTWRLGARLNHADFYDLFGPTKSSRKGQRYYVGYDKTLMYDSPRHLSVSAELNHYRDMDALPRYQNVAATIDEFSTLSIDLGYENVRQSLGAVDDEKGFSWNIGGAVDYVEGDTISKLFGNFDFGFPLPWKHSSVWLRTAAGVSSGEQDDEFANFYFGGFGNNYVDRGRVKRYRENYAIPGFELNAIPGTSFARTMLEWNLPPIRFRRVGTPNFYLSWARPALFASLLETNLDDDIQGLTSESYGIQIDFRFTVMARFKMTLSTGFARGYSDGGFEDDEFMISLKIM